MWTSFASFLQGTYTHLPMRNFGKQGFCTVRWPDSLRRAQKHFPGRLGTFVQMADQAWRFCATYLGHSPGRRLPTRCDREARESSGRKATALAAHTDLVGWHPTSASSGLL